MAVTSSAVNIAIKSTGNYFGGTSWNRSSTTLNITSSNHGLSTGDTVVVRNASEDYVYSAITNIDANKFSIPVADSGDTSGTDAGYIVAYSASFTEGPSGTGDIGSVTITTATSAISASQQLGSINISSNAQETEYTLTVPRGIESGGAGLATNRINFQIPICYGMGEDNEMTNKNVTAKIAASDVTAGNFNTYTLVNTDGAVGESMVVKVIF